MAGANPEELENNEKSDQPQEKESPTESTAESAVTENEVPAECLIKHPLQNTWTLWYYEPDRSRDWEENQSVITSFDTVEDFWSLYNHLRSATEIKIGSDYSLFKKDVKPMWEDEVNKRGGKWVISLTRQQRQTDLDRIWLDVILCLIGEAFDNAEQICGAVVQIRPRGDKIAIWTADCRNKTAIQEIGTKLKACLRLVPQFQITYHFHSDTMAKAGSAVKAAFVL